MGETGKSDFLPVVIIPNFRSLTREFYTPSQQAFPSKNITKVHFPPPRYEMVLPGNLLWAVRPHPSHAVSTVTCTVKCISLFVKTVTKHKSPDTRKETFYFSRGSRTVSKHNPVWNSESLFCLLKGCLAKILVNGLLHIYAFTN